MPKNVSETKAAFCGKVEKPERKVVPSTAAPR